MICRRAAYLVLFPLVGMPLPSLACGISTHLEVAHRAGWWFDSVEQAEYREQIGAHPESLQGGASFPDWGFALPNYGDAAETAHWDPFIQAAADYIHRTYPQPWDEETWRTVVFLLAVTAHSVADISWHGLGIAEGMIDMMAAQDFRGDWNAAHTAADVGGDMVAAYELDQSYMTGPWYVPIRDMVAVYHEIGYEEVSADVLIAGNFLIFLGGHAEKLAGQVLYPPFASSSPMLAEHFQDYFIGGVDDMSTWSAVKWNEVIQWMEEGVPDARMTAATPHFHHDNGFLTSVQDGLRLLHAHQLHVTITPTPRGIVFQLERSGGDSGDRPAAEGAAGLLSDRGASKLLQASPHGSRGGPSPARGGARVPQGEGSGPVYAASEPYAHLGTSLASGDFNGDGFPDLAMGAPGYGWPGHPQLGAAFILAGRSDPEFWSTSEVLDPFSSDRVLVGAEDYGRLAWSMTSLDLNLDGFDDLVVSSPTSGGLHLGYEGRVMVYGGSPEGLQVERPLLTIRSETSYDTLGHSLSRGDVNGDGQADLLIGAPHARAGGTQRGKVATFFSSALVDVEEGRSVDSAEWTAVGTQDYEWFGQHMALFHGLSESVLLVGAPTYDSGDLQGAGRICAFPISDTGPAGQPSLVLTGIQEFGQAGQWFAAGDPGTGEDLLALSLPTWTEGSFKQTGQVILTSLTGLSGEVPLSLMIPYGTLTGSQDFQRFGRTLVWSDSDGDAIQDLWLSAPWRFGEAGPESGSVFGWSGASLEAGVLPHADLGSDHEVEGQEAAARFGSALVFADLDRDGYPEMVVGSRQSSLKARLGGTVQIWPGSTLTSSSQRLSPHHRSAQNRSPLGRVPLSGSAPGGFAPGGTSQPRDRSIPVHGL